MVIFHFIWFFNCRRDEADSIYFMNHVDDGISNWRGLRLYGYDNPEQYTMSYVSISGTDDAGMYLTDLDAGTTVSISHSTFQNNPWAGLYLSWIYTGETCEYIELPFINNQEGMYNYYTGYYSNRLNVQSSLFTQNSRGLYHSDYAGGSFANCSFIDNENEGIYINPSFSSENSSFLSSNLFGNGSSYEVNVGCCNDENIQAEINMQLSNWGEETTAR